MIPPEWKQRRKVTLVVKLDEPWVFENLMARRESPEVSSRNIITKFGSRMNFVGIFMMRHNSGNQIRKTLSVIYHASRFTKVLRPNNERIIFPWENFVIEK